MRTSSKTGTSTGGIETSFRYRRKMAEQRKAEDERAAALCGPVKVYKVDPATLKQKSAGS